MTSSCAGERSARLFWANFTKRERRPSLARRRSAGGSDSSAPSAAFAKARPRPFVPSMRRSATRPRSIIERTRNSTTSSGTWGDSGRRSMRRASFWHEPRHTAHPRQRLSSMCARSRLETRPSEFGAARGGLSRFSVQDLGRVERHHPSPRSRTKPKCCPSASGAVGGRGGDRIDRSRLSAHRCRGGSSQTAGAGPLGRRNRQVGPDDGS